MSIQYCDRHDLRYDTDYQLECPRCVFEAEAAVEADRKLDEMKLRDADAR